MFGSCKKAMHILSSSLEEHGLLSGISDIIVVVDQSGHYKSTQFFACFGSLSYEMFRKPVRVLINKTLINSIQFTVNKYGYLHPTTLESDYLAKLCLHYGKNTIEYQIGEFRLSAEIYLYHEGDKILISDFDGTATKNDLGGLYNNYFGKNYLHDGYHELINGIADNGYKIVWMTMRSLPLYNFSKKYIQEHIGCSGPLLMEPEQFFQAAKKEILKKTGNIKANVIRNIRQIFPIEVNPFIGGLGNRENDAIAYLHSGISLQRIYLIDKKSQVHKLDNVNHRLNYKQIHKQIQTHFPKYKTNIISKHRYRYTKKNSETSTTRSLSAWSLKQKIRSINKEEDQALTGSYI